MIIKLAEYTIQEHALDEVCKAIDTFVKAIDAHEQDTFYEAFRREGTNAFVHLMKFPDHDAEERHAQSDYTNTFVEVLYPLCVEKPIFTDLTPINHG